MSKDLIRIGNPVGLVTGPAQIAEALMEKLERRGREGELVIWEASYARAYVYSGAWVADCPQRCGNVEPLTREDKRITTYVCSYCKTIATSIHWPENAEEIMAVLDRRPIPHTRNWYPTGHRTALEYGLDDGQTIEELIEENRANGVF